MSVVEETLDRIKNQPGVEGYVLCNHEGAILRRLPTMTQATAEKYVQSMTILSSKASHVVRDLEPQDELKILRIRAIKKEIVVYHDQNFLAIVIQQWIPSSSSSTSS